MVTVTCGEGGGNDKFELIGANYNNGQRDGHATACVRENSPYHMRLGTC